MTREDAIKESIVVESKMALEDFAAAITSAKQLTGSADVEAAITKFCKWDGLGTVQYSKPMKGRFVSVEIFTRPGKVAGVILKASSAPYIFWCADGKFRAVTGSEKSELTQGSIPGVVIYYPYTVGADVLPH